MPTEVVKIVDPDNGSGTHYTSLSAWESGEQKNLVTADEIAVAKCRSTSGSADTTQVTIAGWTTDSTRYPVVTYYDNSNRATAAWSDNKYRLYASLGTSAILLNIAQNYTRVIGIQIHCNLTGHWPKAVGIDCEYGYLIGCFVRMSGGNYAGTGVSFRGVSASGNPTAIIVNNVIRSTSTYNHSDNTGLGCASHPNTTDFSPIIYNNTVYGYAYGAYIADVNAKVIMKNNLFASQATRSLYFAGTPHSSSNYNATSDNYSTGGSNDRTNQTFTFVNTSGNDFHLASTDTGAKDYGTNLSSDSYYAFSDDIDGDTRSGTWDIGADEYVASGGGVVLPIYMAYYRRRRMM